MTILLGQCTHHTIYRVVSNVVFIRYYNAWIESLPAPVDYTNGNTDDSTFDSDSSSSDSEEANSEDYDSEGEMDDSLFIDFHQSEHSSRQNHSYSDELSDLSLDNSIIGAQQLEANLMDTSPNKLRRK